MAAGPASSVAMATPPAAEGQPPAQSPEHLQAPPSAVGQKRSFISRWFGSPAAADGPAGAERAEEVGEWEERRGEGGEEEGGQEGG